MKQFLVSGKPSATLDFDPAEFERKIDELYKPEDLKDGYAPFCKHLFVENFTPAKVYYSAITSENEKLLKTVYEARTEKELPVLKRFFSKTDVEVQRAKYLDIILYSKEQVAKENASMQSTDPNAEIPYEWAIVSVKAQDHTKEIPMDPITAMRNALGKEEGGSGVPIDRQKYLESVAFWEKHARDPLCLTNFYASGNPIAMIDYDPVEFEKKINEIYRPEDLEEGYAPFCKHLFLKNFTPSKVYYAPITTENEKLLKTEYAARFDGELPVLKRFFNKKEVAVEPAKYLDIILYSKAQKSKEVPGMLRKDANADIPYEWSIVWVKVGDITAPNPWF